MKPPLKRILAGAVLIALAAAPGASLRAQTPNRSMVSGLWELKTRVLIITDTSRECLGPTQANSYFDGPCGDRYVCTYSVAENINGKSRFEGVWVNRGDRKRSSMRATGTYTDRSFHLNVKLTGAQNLSGTMDGRLINPVCPPGSKGNPH